MNKKCFYAISAVFLALSGIGTTANATTKKTNNHYRPKTEKVNNFYGNYFVNAPATVKTSTRTIYGTASPGIHVILKSSASSKRILASTYASKRNGHYRLTIPTKYTKKDGKICVMARKGYFYPYRYVSLINKTNKKSTKQTNLKQSNKKINRKQNNSNRKNDTTKNSKKNKSKRSKTSKTSRNTNRNIKRNSTKSRPNRLKINKKNQKANQNTEKIRK